MRMLSFHLISFTGRAASMTILPLSNRRGQFGVGANTASQQQYHTPLNVISQ